MTDPPATFRQLNRELMDATTDNERLHLDLSAAMDRIANLEAWRGEAVEAMQGAAVWLRLLGKPDVAAYLETISGPGREDQP